MDRWISSNLARRLCQPHRVELHVQDEINVTNLIQTTLDQIQKQMEDAAKSSFSTRSRRTREESEIPEEVQRRERKAALSERPIE